MRTYLLISLLSYSALNVFGQARMVINNDAYLVIDNSANLVIDNPNANALTTAGTGGNIISEAENNVIKWNISTTTGNYQIPYTTSSSVKIPFSMNISGAGTGTGHFLFSTYETSTDMNAPHPSVVTNMDSEPLGGADGSLYVIDRFWQVGATSYTAKPTVSMIIGYDPAANEMGGTNTIVESNLRAQRYNDDIDDWQGYNMYGTNDAGNDRVTAITPAAADFYSFWTLVDFTNPLPVSLANFEASCNEEHVVIDWVTASEINNDYFVVEKSYDGVVYFDLATVQGNGTTNISNYYSVTDDENAVKAYYRLGQVDYNGTTEFFEPSYATCGNREFVVDQFELGQNSFEFNITAAIDEEVEIAFYDVRGRLISAEKSILAQGDNTISLKDFSISRGMYLLSIQGSTNSFSTKLMKQ